MKTLTITAILFAGFTALAAPTQRPVQMVLGDALLAPLAPGKERGENPCSKVNLTDAQKAVLKEKMLDSADARIQDEAAVKRAMLASYRTLARVDSTREQGQAANDAVLAAMATYGKNVSDLEISIMYDVLQPEQREPALMCAMYMKHKKAKGGHGGH